MAFPIRVREIGTRSQGPTPSQGAESLRNYISVAAGAVNVTPAKALRVPEVLGCVNVIAQSMSMLPFSVYKRDGETRERDREHPVHKLLSQSPNSVQSPVEFTRMMTWHCASRGNAFAHKTSIGGRPLKLTPIHPDKVQVRVREDWSTEYSVSTATGATQIYSSDEIFHLRGPISAEAHESESPVVWCKEAIATLMVVQQFTSTFFQGGAKAKGGFRLPDGGALSDEAYDRLKNQIQEMLESDRAPLMEQGLEWVAMDYSARDSLLSEIARQQEVKICRIFRIQPHLIQLLADATFSNIEHQGREFVDHTLMPWIRLWEGAVHKQLMDPEDQDVYPKFSVQALLRGDSKTRSEVYNKAVGGPFMTPNEARSLEDMDQIDGGDDLLKPLNMGNATDVKPEGGNE